MNDGDDHDYDDYHGGQLADLVVVFLLFWDFFKNECDH